MEISRVTYSRTKQINHAESHCIEISADINEQDSATEALTFLQEWIEEKLDIQETIAELETRRGQLQDQIYRLEKDLNVFKNRWESANHLLNRFGISTELDSIPF